MAVPNPKRGEILWTCGKYHVIGENMDYKAIGLRGFGNNIFE